MCPAPSHFLPWISSKPSLSTPLRKHFPVYSPHPTRWIMILLLVLAPYAHTHLCYSARALWNHTLYYRLTYLNVSLLRSKFLKARPYLGFFHHKFSTGLVHKMLSINVKYKSVCLLQLTAVEQNGSLGVTLRAVVYPLPL